MNYYNRFPAEWLIETLHLSVEQDGFYNRMVDWYYRKERPIPHVSRYEIARVTTEAHRADVDFVLNEFFVLGDTGWRHKRVEAEIAAAQVRIETARTNGKTGGRPRKKPAGFPDGIPPGSSEVTQPEPTGEAHHPPSSIEASGSNPSLGDSSCADAGEGEGMPNQAQLELATAAGNACRLMRAKGCGRTNPSHTNLLNALAEGITPEQLADYAAVAVEANAGNPFSYAIAAARNDRAKGNLHVTPANRSSRSNESAVELVRRANDQAAAHDRLLEHPSSGSA